MHTSSLRINGQERVGRAWLAWLLMFFTAVLVSSCSPLGAFNTVAGRDSGIEIVASDIAYGPNPRQKLDIYAPRVRSASVPVVVFFYPRAATPG